MLAHKATQRILATPYVPFNLQLLATMCHPSIVPSWLLFSLILFSGCSSDSGPTNLDDSTADRLPNSMIVDGGQFNKVSVVFDSANAKITYPSGTNLTQFDIHGTISAGKRLASVVGEEVMLRLQFPDTNLAEHSWSSLRQMYSVDIAFLEIAGEKYYPVSGVTKVERYDSDVVEGTFQGTLVHASTNEEIVISKGRFMGKRPTSTTGGVDQSYRNNDLYLVLNGGQFEKDTIAVPDVSALSRVMYESGGNYLSAIITPGTVPIPGKGNVNIAITLDYPSTYVGTWAWRSRANSTFFINIDGEVYVGISGRTIISKFGQSFFSEVSGHFDGTVQHTENGQAISIDKGWFRSARAN